MTTYRPNELVSVSLPPEAMGKGGRTFANFFEEFEGVVVLRMPDESLVIVNAERVRRLD